MFISNLVDAGGFDLTAREKVFKELGFDCFPKGAKSVCFRQFFKVSALQPIWVQRLKRLGAQAGDDISLCFSESDNLVSVCVLPRDIFIEFEADSKEGVGLMWAFGLEL